MDEHKPLGGSWTRERWFGFVVAVAGYSLYFPISDIVATLPPVPVGTALDEWIPLSPPWILIYAMIYPAAFLPLVVVRDPLVFRKMILGYLCLEATSLLFFLVTPVHMTLRPPIASVTEPGFFPWAVQLCYFIDHPTCCFPSLHVAAATFSALACLKVDRFVGIGATVVAILIAFSTLLVKQHFLADVVFGASLALFWYTVFVRRAKPLGTVPLAYRRRGVLIPAGLFSIIIALIFGAYQSGWGPWLEEGRLP